AALAPAACHTFRLPVGSRALLRRRRDGGRLAAFYRQRSPSGRGGPLGSRPERDHENHDPLFPITKTENLGNCGSPQNGATESPAWLRLFSAATVLLGLLREHRRICQLLKGKRYGNTGC